MADDRKIIEQIGRLADEERRLEEAHAGEGLTPRTGGAWASSR